MDIVTTYADLMGLCFETVGTNLLNSKLSYVFFRENNRAAESFKKLYDRFASGEPLSVVDKRLKDKNGEPAWQLFTQNVGQNYISNLVLDDMKTIEDRFNTDIGIPNANTQKRERMLVDEVNVNNVDTQSKVLLWLETMQDGVRKVNEMFGTEITVRLGSSWYLEHENYESLVTGVEVTTEEERENDPTNEDTEQPAPTEEQTEQTEDGNEQEQSETEDTDQQEKDKDQPADEDTEEQQKEKGGKK